MNVLSIYIRDPNVLYFWCFMFFYFYFLVLLMFRRVVVLLLQTAFIDLCIKLVSLSLEQYFTDACWMSSQFFFLTTINVGNVRTSLPRSLNSFYPSAEGSTSTVLSISRRFLPRFRRTLVHLLFRSPKAR